MNTSASLFIFFPINESFVYTERTPF